MINATKSSSVDVRASKQMSKPEDGGQSTLSGNGTKSAGQPARTESTVAFSAGSIASPQRNFTPTHASVHVHRHDTNDKGAMNLATTARCTLFMGRFLPVDIFPLVARVVQGRLHAGRLMMLPRSSSGMATSVEAKVRPFASMQTVACPRRGQNAAEQGRPMGEQIRFHARPGQ